MSEIGPQDRSMAYWPKVEVINSALEAVADLSRTMPLFVATNASISYKPDIVAALNRGGLSSYFADVFCFMDIGFKKNQKGCGIGDKTAAGTDCNGWRFT